MDKTFTSVVAALFFVLSASVAFASDAHEVETQAQKREVASDFTSDYLEQVKDEKAAETTKDRKDAEEHEKYLKSMRGHDR